MTEQRRILLISTDPTFRYHAALAFASRGCSVDVLAAADPLTPDNLADIDAVVLEAARDSPLSVVEVIDAARARWSVADLPIAVCLAEAEMLESHRMYLTLRGCGVHGRPFDPEAILAALDHSRTLDLTGVIPSRAPAWS
ncbi:MAG: hypothetical protein M9890_11030 [Thermomicrobiales bacterium]|nr:hypothetical protein [Thermomicrobiales bacterium]